MIVCPTCNRRVNYSYLRTENPRCEDGHDLGKWVCCSNSSEKHVYLRRLDNTCPYCGMSGFAEMSEGMKIKCLHKTDEGVECVTRPFLWIKEGPPCFMNHIDKMKVVV